jgi:hypothetical protein
MAFLAIVVTPNLSPSQHRLAVRSGPPGVASRRDHRTLVRAAGFYSIEESDVTSGYLHTLHAWTREASAHEHELRAALGDALFEDRQNDRSVQASAVENGLLRRSLFVARPSTVC